MAHPPRFDTARAVFDYRFPLDRLVQRFKFASDLASGRWLAAQLAEVVAGERKPDVLIAPPLSAQRLRERGFNQALEIARAVGYRLRVRAPLGAVERTRATSPQPGLTREERRRNLRGAFRCRVDLSGRSVAIVDDVLTTGATADELAATLKQAGAMHVAVWVVARTPEPARAIS